MAQDIRHEINTAIAYIPDIPENAEQSPRDLPKNVAETAYLVLTKIEMQAYGV